MFRCLYSERLVKRAKRGNVGHPVATIAFYGPDDTRASKLVVAIVPELVEGDDEDEELELIAERKWFSDSADLRWDVQACRETIAFIDEHGAKSVVMPETLLGCPHEEVKDYPEGQDCPQCPFWAGRDRFAGTQLADRRAEYRVAKARMLAEMAARGAADED